MTIARQVQLRRGSTTLDLGASPYKLIAGSWANAGEALELKVLVQGTTLVALRRNIAAIRQMLNQAAHYAGENVGSAVYVYQKECDDISTVAELGATWLRKLIKNGTLLEPDPSESATGQYTSICSLSLETEDTWRRAAPESVIVASVAPTVRSDGGLTVAAGETLIARRMKYTAASGLTVRVRWLYSDNNCYLFFAETGANDVYGMYSATQHVLAIGDAAGAGAISSALNGTYTAGDELDIVFKWAPGVKMGIWVNGAASGSVPACTLGIADTFQVFAPSVASQTLLSWQAWPTALTDAQCAALSAWGRPEPELACSVSPTDLKNTNAAYRFYNVPGEADALLRVALSDGTQAYDKARIGLRPLRIQTTTLWECEAGTNGADVADAADASASGGNMAQFTPSDTASATRSTIVLAANPADVAAFYGQYRLLLAVKDNAASVGLNLIKWRLVTASVNGDYSDEFSAAAVGTYSLLDLGTLQIPPGAWPEETDSVTGDVHAGSYLTLELAVRNTAGLGGGTLNLDAVYLQPVELEGTIENAAWTTAQYQLIDHASPVPGHVAVADYRTFEYAGWGDYVGDVLSLAPVTGDAGLALLYAYRNTAEQAYPNETLTAWWWIVPRWM